MLVKLKVLEGASAGRELPVAGPEFVIGRSEECHLRPKSDMVSRRHCALVIDDSGVTLRDFGSKNGTNINGQRVEGQLRLKPGDELSIGPLRFTVMIDHTLGVTKKPVVKDVKEAASRASSDKSGSVSDLDISGWLSEADEVDRERRIHEPETRQFRLDETEAKALKAAKDKAEGTPTGDTAAVPKDEKKEPGKLPPRPDNKTKNSQEAAAQMLKRLFKAN